MATEFRIVDERATVLRARRHLPRRHLFQALDRRRFTTAIEPEGGAWDRKAYNDKCQWNEIIYTQKKERGGGKRERERERERERTIEDIG